ncbi:hypothetical protein ACS3QZ_20025 (plasmid) [Shimia sp. W99]
MDTGKGVLFRDNDESKKGEIYFEGVLHFGDEQQICCALMNLHSEPHPELRLDIENRTVLGVLEMNAGQQSRAEPDFMGFVHLDGQRYAAGIWIPRKKSKKPHFLLIMRAAIPENRMTWEPLNKV